MTKNKRLVSRMMLTLVVLTLVSFCCVGFTFARYTSTGSGTATATIAKWSVTGTFEGTSETPVSLSMISPKAADYTGETYVAANARTNTTAPVEVLTITNASDVEAWVELTVTKPETGSVSFATGMPANTLTEDQVWAHFTVEICKQNGDAFTAEELKLAAKTGTLEVYAKITWTSDLATIFGTDADAEDTLIGQYVTALNFGITYKAVQGTQIPAAPAA